jgi:hypothetical protein
VSEHRAILNYFLERAKWRNEKAAEYPEDDRNRLAAAALRGLGGYVLRLSDEDERIRELGTLAVREGMFMPFPEGQRLISRFGFDNPEQDSGAFLDELVRVTRSETLAFAREHGALPDEQDS